MQRCIAVYLGETEYANAWEIQKRMHHQVAEGLLPNLLLLLEHPHVYTLGRRGKSSDILASPEKLSYLGAEVHYVDRGGEVTYHGPGQLVVYPIVNLRTWPGGPLKYIRTLETTITATLAKFGINAQTSEKPTGVWVGEAKISSIGVKISRGVTMHGLSLNVSPDLSYFDHIVPCGMSKSQTTSMTCLLKREIFVEEVIADMTRKFELSFEWEVEWGSLDDLEQILNVPK